ncbi:MAG: Maf-like protein [Phyllobacterium sp.]
MDIILASKSPFRAMLLDNAGVPFTARSADIDERAIEAPLYGSGVTPEDVALVLAEAKAVNVSEGNPSGLTIGSDQTLSLGDEVLHKPESMEAARRQLLKLSGRTHHLNSAVVLAKEGQVVWRYVSVARMTLRDLDPAFIGRHLSRVGTAALQSVGAYQFEGEGVQLFEKVEGDYFTIVGLPLLPLLAELRREGAIDG